MLKVGIIGHGYWGPNLLRNFMDADAVRVVGVSDLRADRLKSVIKRYPDIRTTTDARDLIADPGIDAIAVATPVATHYPLALEALRAGKHVIVEKPMAETSEQARHLLEEAARRNLTLMVDHTFLYTSAVQKIKELADNGELGTLNYYDSTRINLGLFQRDVNVIWDLAVHDLSILDYLLGEDEGVAAVSATGASHIQGTPENMAYLTLHYESGTIAHINVNWMAPVKVRQTLIGGSRKMVVYNDLEPSEKIKVYDRGVTVTDDTEQLRQILIGYRIGDMWAPRLSADEALRLEVAHFRDCVVNGTTPLSDGAMGLRIVTLLEAATISMRRRGQPVEMFPLRRAS